MKSDNNISYRLAVDSENRPCDCAPPRNHDSNLVYRIGEEEHGLAILATIAGSVDEEVRVTHRCEWSNPEATVDCGSNSGNCLVRCRPAHQRDHGIWYRLSVKIHYGADQLTDSLRSFHVADD